MTARLVLVNVPAPEEILAEMVRLVRPGGAVALHELELLAAYGELNGIDRSIGLRVPRMLREAGLLEVRVNPLVHAYPREHGRRMLLLDFVENARERILEKNLIGAGELAELTSALERHLADPATLVLSSVFLQTWGRAPER